MLIKKAHITCAFFDECTLGIIDISTILAKIANFLRSSAQILMYVPRWRSKIRPFWFKLAKYQQILE